MATAERHLPEYAYAKYVASHGTASEIERLKAEYGFIHELLAEFPGAEREPLDHVILIGHLVDRADRLAARRLDAAKRLRYRDTQGKIGRTIVEERATVRAQFAAQTMLGLPLGKPDTYQAARQVGNIGGGHDAFVPTHNSFSHHLIVDPRTKDEITCWLVVDEGGHAYRLSGWIPAAEAKSSSFERTRQREGGTSKAYWVPPGALYSVAEWWAR